MNLGIPHCNCPVCVSWGFGLVILFVEDIKTLLCFHNLEEEKKKKYLRTY